MEEQDIYGDSNAGELKLNDIEEILGDAENTDSVIENVDEFEEEPECDKICNPDQFCIKSTEGISINGVKFSRGTYTIGQLVGTITIDEGVKQNLLSTDAKAIASNRHSA